MPFETEDANGNKIQVFTQAELEAQRKQLEKEYQSKLDDKDTHAKSKLDEFMNARKADQEKQDQFKVETAAQIAAAQKSADEAKQSAIEAEGRRLSAYKDFLVKNSLGEDADLITKFNEAYNLINMPIGTDAEIQARVMKTLEFSGLNNTVKNIPVNMSGGYAPRVDATQKAEKDADFDKFTSILGLGGFTKPPEGDKK